MVKRLRRRPLTAQSRVRFPARSPTERTAYGCPFFVGDLAVCEKRAGSSDAKRRTRRLCRRSIPGFPFDLHPSWVTNGTDSLRRSVFCWWPCRVRETGGFVRREAAHTRHAQGIPACRRIPQPRRMEAKGSTRHEVQSIRGFPFNLRLPRVSKKEQTNVCSFLRWMKTHAAKTPAQGNAGSFCGGKAPALQSSCKRTASAVAISIVPSPSTSGMSTSPSFTAPSARYARTRSMI